MVMGEGDGGTGLVAWVGDCVSKVSKIIVEVRGIILFNFKDPILIV